MNYIKNIRRVKSPLVFPKNTFVFDFYNEKNQYKGTYKIETILLIKKLFGKKYIKTLNFEKFKLFNTTVKQLKTLENDKHQ